MTSTAISAVHAREVWDSRGRPTVEVEVTLASGAKGRAIAPSGASTGSREALDMRDGGARLGGFGVNRAIAAVKELVAPALVGLDAGDQLAVDAAMLAADGTAQKTRIGGNAAVATSCAAAWAASAALGVPLWAHLRTVAGLSPEPDFIPAPMIQIFGGGAHAGNRIDVQDFLVIATGASSFAEAVEWTAEVYRAALAIMRQTRPLQGVADEGGIWPDFSGNEEALDVLTRAIEAAGLKPCGQMAIAMDVAATNFFRDGAYVLAADGSRRDTAGMIDMLARWCATYPIVSLEDPLAEDDDGGFAEITRLLGSKVQIVGDDYLTTSAERIRHAAGVGACNAVLLKANQCGTITELIAASAAARALAWNAIQSGRSGESEDVTLSHLAVGLRSDQIKVGSVTRSERTAKWNEVIRIEEGARPGSFWKFRLPS